MRAINIMTAISFSLFAFIAMAEDISPVFTGAELKVTYPCSVLETIPRSKVDSTFPGEVIFYDKNGNPFYQQGYILRKRILDNDFTLKFRSKSPFLVDSSLYSALTASQSGDFKCELDFTYDPKGYEVVRSCSFKAPGESLMKEHKDLTLMMKRPLEDWDFTLRGLKTPSAQVLSWKIELTSAQKKENPFDKKPEVEVWKKGADCRLETSGKFKLAGMSEAQIDKKVRLAFDFLKGLVPASPATEQGNKTPWVLGIK